MPEAARKDHPREYGENILVFSFDFLDQGSSPRIRGKYGSSDQMQRWPGIIPANTGKICTLLTIHSQGWDHPREYGENRAGYRVHVGGGSSPRIRGKSFDASEGQSVLGIIPANTGKMLSWLSVPQIQRDHPREYGENRNIYPRHGFVLGSSPRIRGK